MQSHYTRSSNPSKNSSLHIFNPSVFFSHLSISVVLCCMSNHDQKLPWQEPKVIFYSPLKTQSGNCHYTTLSMPSSTYSLQGSSWTQISSHIYTYIISPALPYKTKSRLLTPPFIRKHHWKEKVLKQKCTERIHWSATTLKPLTAEVNITAMSLWEALGPANHVDVPRPMKPA